MSASLNELCLDVTSQDLLHEYVWDRAESDPAEKCAALGAQQQSDGLDHKQNILGELNPVGPSMVQDTDDDSLFQTNTKRHSTDRKLRPNYRLYYLTHPNSNNSQDYQSSIFLSLLYLGNASLTQSYFPDFAAPRKNPGCRLYCELT